MSKKSVARFTVIARRALVSSMGDAGEEAGPMIASNTPRLSAAAMRAIDLKRA
eukprot:CAMPEP_0174758098 /NCGR_PEP_ID=MMETSP1094-20130205/107595_1 /TAXON_ID=156173 /ORGANISM="Chrysochromulina brevifilum, Strain UTEX LB 985" /LENGTH=52 /DNA_ID=CAMNT_0015964023 /DNA_START=961 /DNA_END=1119 /DNA_ORIENTATION=-